MGPEMAGEKAFLVTACLSSVLLAVDVGDVEA